MWPQHSEVDLPSSIKPNALRWSLLAYHTSISSRSMSAYTPPAVSSLGRPTCTEQQNRNMSVHLYSEDSVHSSSCVIIGTNYVSRTTKQTYQRTSLLWGQCTIPQLCRHQGDLRVQNNKKEKWVHICTLHQPTHLQLCHHYGDLHKQNNKTEIWVYISTLRSAYTPQVV